MDRILLLHFRSIHNNNIRRTRAHEGVLCWLLAYSRFCLACVSETLCKIDQRDLFATYTHGKLPEALGETSGSGRCKSALPFLERSMTFVRDFIMNTTFMFSFVIGGKEMGKLSHGDGHSDFGKAAPYSKLYY